MRSTAHLHGANGKLTSTSFGAAIFHSLLRCFYSPLISQVSESRYGLVHFMEDAGFDLGWSTYLLCICRNCNISSMHSEKWLTPMHGLQSTSSAKWRMNKAWLLEWALTRLLFYWSVSSSQTRSTDDLMSDCSHNDVLATSLDNLLLSTNCKKLKLTDFGLAREETTTEMMTTETETYWWMATEVIHHSFLH